MKDDRQSLLAEEETDENDTSLEGKESEEKRTGLTSLAIFTVRWSRHSLRSSQSKDKSIAKEGSLSLTPRGFVVCLGCGFCSREKSREEGEGEEEGGRGNQEKRREKRRGGDEKVRRE